MSEQQTTDRAKYTPGPYEAGLQKIMNERDALAAFKAYVHKRFDDADVPIEGCRIGVRLDIVLARYVVVPEMLKALRAAGGALEWYAGLGAAATDALKEIRAAIAKAEGK